MTRKDAVRRLKLCKQSTDTEAAHMQADNILVELLSALGYHDVVNEYAKVKKWYA